MNEELRLLFQKRATILYPVVDLTGKRNLVSLNTPFFGLADILFQPGSVFVKTVSFDNTEEIEITVYEGRPRENIIPKDIISASGTIEVGKEGIVLGAGGSKEAVFQWPEGLTDVLVLLKAIEASKKQIRSITFYIKQIKETNHRHGLANICKIK